jgi:hypothetical protein
VPECIAPAFFSVYCKIPVNQSNYYGKGEIVYFEGESELLDEVKISWLRTPTG